jgi:type I restriction enzyme R subunit
MAKLESVIEQRLIDQLCSGESQWTYRPDITTEEDLWRNFKYILEQNNKAKLNDTPLSDSEFSKVKNDLSHASFFDAGKWLIGGKWQSLCPCSARKGNTASCNNEQRAYCGRLFCL